MVYLKNAKKNRLYKILGFEGDLDVVSRRFMELGLISGEKVRVISTSLQKKVYLIEIRGYLLSVRASLLQKIQVEEC